MNELYVKQVLDAHSRCRELQEMQRLGLYDTAEFVEKASAYVEFMLSCDTGDWHIPVHMLKLFVSNYNIQIDLSVSPLFSKFAEKYNGKINNVLTQEFDKSINLRKYFLSDELLYLKDVGTENNQ